MSHTPPMLLGIDGGATRVRAALADPHGHIVGFGIAGAASYSSSQRHAMIANIDTATHDATSQAHLDTPSVSTFWGLAGVVTQSDRDDAARLANQLRAVTIQRIDVDHDIRSALAGGLDGRPGIALISGTGSSCYGRDATGQSWQAGGWECLIDDRGAAYDIALRGLSAAARSIDGRGENTELADALFHELNIATLPEIIRKLHADGLDNSGKPATKEQIAGLAPLVFSTAARGDAIANAILDEAADELICMIRAVARNLGWQTSPVDVITEGSVANNPDMAKRLKARLAVQVPEAGFVPSHLPPVGGSVLLAAKLAGIEITQDWIDTLADSLAPLFDAGANSTPPPSGT